MKSKNIHIQEIKQTPPVKLNSPSEEICTHCDAVLTVTHSIYKCPECNYTQPACNACIHTQDNDTCGDCIIGSNFKEASR